MSAGVTSAVGRDTKRIGLSILLPSLVLLVVVAWGQITGARTLFFRDVGNFHLPAKWSQIESYRASELPFVDLHRAGQPGVGNPNTVPFYPDNLLYFLTPFWWAFNAHFWLHLLLAPFSGYVLGRAWGLSRPASWACGLSYATSAFFLSIVGSLYNLVAAATLAPLLAGATVRALSVSKRQGPWLLAIGASVALILLGGDPVLAAISFLGAALAVGFAGRSAETTASSSLLGQVRLAAAAGLGALVALPQYVEMARLVPQSTRTMLGLAEGTLRYAAFHPAEVVDWLLPFAFGRPNLGYWGKRLNPDGEPIFFTLHIGLVALALVLASGRARTQGQRWAWTMVAVGIFMGLGGHNPLLAWLSTVPGIQAFRFPIKFWLLVVVGTSTLVGYACERLLRGEGRVSLRRAVLALVLLEIALLAIAVEGRGRLAAWVVGVALPASRLEEIWRFWLASAVLALLLLLGALAILWLLRRRPVAAVTALIALQTASQLWWLSPLLATDERREFAEPPAALRFLTKGQLALNALEQDGSGNEVSVRLTDRESRSLQRVHWVRLAPFSGVLHGVDYELFLAPEGLDSHFAYRTSLAMEGASDVTQVRLARALGVDVLITPRPAVGPARDLLTLRGTATAPAVTTFVYGVDHTAPPIVVSGDIVRTPDVGSMLTAAIDPQFDPTSMVVAAGPGGRTRGRVGRAVVVRESANEVVARFEAPDPAVAVVRRAYLPIYRATVDGNPAPIVLANAQRLGVEVPAGEHDLRIWVDRRPFYWSLLVSAVAVGGLWGLAWSSRARPRADGVPA